MVSWSTPDLKLYNKELIRKEIQNNETCRKSQIAQLTSLSIGTCNTAINEMLRDNEIIKVDQEELIMGRPADRFCYNKDYFHVMGMYLSGEHRCNRIEYAVADALGNENVHESIETEAITYGVIEKIVDEMLAADPLIESLSIGIPGITSGESWNGVIFRRSSEWIWKVSFAESFISMWKCAMTWILSRMEPIIRFTMVQPIWRLCFSVRE